MAAGLQPCQSQPFRVITNPRATRHHGTQRLAAAGRRPEPDVAVALRRLPSPRHSPRNHRRPRAHRHASLLGQCRIAQRRHRPAERRGFSGARDQGLDGPRWNECLVDADRFRARGRWSCADRRPSQRRPRGKPPRPGGVGAREGHRRTALAVGARPPRQPAQDLRALPTAPRRGRRRLGVRRASNIRRGAEHLGRPRDLRLPGRFAKAVQPRSHLAWFQRVRRSARARPVRRHRPPCDISALGG